MDPCRKTILLQLDWMNSAADGHDHQPKQAAKQEVIDAFNAAPVDAARTVMKERRFMAPA